MPRVAVPENCRVSLRVQPHDKAMIMRASAIAHTDMTEFMVRSSVRAARELIHKSEMLQLSERDSLRVLDLLENPPAPNSRLVQAARDLFKPS